MTAVWRLLPLVGLAVAVVLAQARMPPFAIAPTFADGDLSSASGRGEALFVQRCAVCHPRGELGAQGPGLGGVFGRKAAKGKGFAYSLALRSSNLTWDRATLDRFLTGPGQLVPGTTMPVSLDDANVRRDVIDFLVSLHPDTSGAARAEASVSLGDYHGDAPGVRRRITAADLPPPFTTPSARNGPTIVDPPVGSRASVPAGFSVEVLAKSLQNPRLLRAAPNGDVFVAETAKGQLRAVRLGADGSPARLEVFATGLDRPFGLAFFPPGRDPRWLYVANVNSIVRFPYRAGDLRARGSPVTVVERLTETAGGHSTRDIAFSNDGAQMLVSVGSASNVAESATTRLSDEIAAWEASHGLGASWDDEEDRADVLAFDPEGNGRHTFATGIRNCVGLATNPETGDVWCATNERDGLGDDLVPDYVTRVRQGRFYGWPWYYIGDHEDPRQAGVRRDLAGRVSVPDVLLQAHSAPLQITFYDGAMFPASYRGDAFVCLHGSWNRSSRTGPKVVRVRLDRGVPTGEYEDFMTGFVVNDADVWARPVGVAVASDGALLVTEDGNGTLWRISYRAP